MKGAACAIFFFNILTHTHEDKKIPSEKKQGVKSTTIGKKRNSKPPHLPLWPRK